jgi:hypothetical protein
MGNYGVSMSNLIKQLQTNIKEANNHDDNNNSLIKIVKEMPKISLKVDVLKEFISLLVQSEFLNRYNRYYY